MPAPASRRGAQSVRRSDWLATSSTPTNDQVPRPRCEVRPRHIQANQSIAAVCQHCDGQRQLAPGRRERPEVRMQGCEPEAADDPRRAVERRPNPTRGERSDCLALFPSATPCAGAVIASSSPLGRHHRRIATDPAASAQMVAIRSSASLVPVYFTLGMMLAPAARGGCRWRPSGRVDFTCWNSQVSAVYRRKGPTRNRRRGRCRRSGRGTRAPRRCRRRAGGRK